MGRVSWRCAVAMVVPVAAGCGGDTTGKLVAGDPGGVQDAGTPVGSGGTRAENGGAPAESTGAHPASSSAPEAGPSGGSGGVWIHVDASVPQGAAGARLEPPTDAALGECRDLSASARRHVVAAISLSCANDSDCTLLDASAECARGCPVAGRADSAASLEKAIAEANRQWCVESQARNCPLQVPECIQTRSACVTGNCTLLYGNLYRFDITNPIDSGETIAVTELDVDTGACVLAEFFVVAGNPTPRYLQAWLMPNARSCCPSAADAQLGACHTSPASPCAYPAAAPNPSGTARVGAGYTLDVDYSFSFPTVPLEMAFRATGLVRDSCVAR